MQRSTVRREHVMYSSYAIMECCLNLVMLIDSVLLCRYVVSAVVPGDGQGRRQHPLGEAGQSGLLS